MNLRGTFLWLKVTIVIVSMPLIGYASNVYKSTYISTWRNIKVTLDSSNPTVAFGDDHHNLLTIKNVGETPLSVPLDANCHTGYKLLNRNKKVIREKSLSNGSCINFEYNDLRLVPGEFVQVDFYIGDLEPGIYRAIFEVPPKDDLVVDFEVLEPVNMTAGLGQRCEFITRKTCEIGLVCSFDGFLPGEPGMCVQPPFDRLNYIPDEDKDYVEWERDRYIQVEQKILFDRSEYKSSFGLFDMKTGYVSESDFEKYMKAQTGREVDVNNEKGYVRKDVALTAMYRTMYRNRHPEDLEVFYFKDSKWSPYGTYIEDSAENGLIDVPESGIFGIDAWVTWEDLKTWERRF